LTATTLDTTRSDGTQTVLQRLNCQHDAISLLPVNRPAVNRSLNIKQT